MAEPSTKPVHQGGWRNYQAAALTEIARRHRRDENNICMVCCDVWPCITWRIADAGLLNKNFDE